MIVPVPAVDVSVERVHEAIDNACDQTNSRLLADDSSHKNSNNNKSVIFRRGTLDDISGLITILKDAQINRDQLVRDFDLVHWIILEKCNQVLGLAAFYWAYSTWDGRVLYVNKVTAPNTELETSLLYTLADIAVQLEGQRLVWQVRPRVYTYMHSPFREDRYSNSGCPRSASSRQVVYVQQYGCTNSRQLVDASYDCRRHG